MLPCMAGTDIFSARAGSASAASRSAVQGIPIGCVEGAMHFLFIAPFTPNWSTPCTVEREDVVVCVESAHSLEVSLCAQSVRKGKRICACLPSCGSVWTRDGSNAVRCGRITKTLAIRS